MNDSYKEQLSNCVENIFKKYITPGLHICDIATGGGKSYTIGKLTCQFYPKHFDRIIILCVQTKLVDAMDSEINKFISKKDSEIKPDAKLVVKNNEDVISQAITSKNFDKLLEDIEYRIGQIEEKGINVKDLHNKCNYIKKVYYSLSELINIPNRNDYLSSQIGLNESNLRKAVRSFFDSYRRIYEYKEKRKKLSVSDVLKQFPSLELVYPQVSIKSKKVLIMTVHKAMYGIDPILSDLIHIDNFSENNKKTLILFDESDQAAIAMRNVIIEQEIKNNGGYKRFGKGYNGYLQYNSLINNSSHLSNEYYGEELEKALIKAQSITSKNWSRLFNNVSQFRNIFLEDDTELDNYRRGVFFSGQTFRLNISQRDDKLNSFICYKNGSREFRLVHCKDENSLRNKYNIVVSLDDFLSLTIRNTIAIKSQLGGVISNALEHSKKRFDEEVQKISNNSSDKNIYLGYPTLEREIHTLFSRFETPSEFQFEEQINDYMTNRKNIEVSVDGQGKKVPDTSVYLQGVQLFQEEVDDMDNMHRVRLSCREINNTPEKIIADLITSSKTSVVLCSATASNMSVVSNFDIQYFQDLFPAKLHKLSDDEKHTFDDLVAKTYPKEHKINVVQVSNHQYADKRENKLYLPEKYKKMFSSDAQDLAESWFKITLRNLKKEKDDIKSVIFYLNRYFQFIEAYYYFITHDDIHSMIFFQNQRGDRDANQFQTLSCLIDGSYKNMKSELDDEIPSDWGNEHIKISKDFEVVEAEIISKLSNNKDAKLMLISAYASFKAGTNLQYQIPESLDYISGDTWDEENPKKDWDAMYLQCPTSYFSTDDEVSENKYETNVYKAMLTLMMLFYRGCLAKYEVASLLYSVLSASQLYFSEDTYQGITKDKALWAQCIIEQAVGRLCRTKNKPYTTHILYDENMAEYFTFADLDKSLTREFRALADEILHNKKETVATPDEIICCNNANYVQSQLNRIRKNALYFTPHNDDMFDYEYDDNDNEDEIPYFVHTNQMINQNYKQTIIKKPVIDSFDELTTEDRLLTFISKCYGNWQRNEDSEFYYSLDDNKRVCPRGKNHKEFSISPSSVRLDILMKNSVIREYFERKGYATNWKQDGYILHPQILAYDYAGEIGEEAFKALLLHYTECSEADIKHLEGRDYELADFVICNTDGSYKIAFDVKNMNPDILHNDRPNDMPTQKKREIKRQRLGCELITINMLKLNNSPIDEIREIGGLIDNNGMIIDSAIKTLKKLVENGEKNNN